MKFIVLLVALMPLVWAAEFQEIAPAKQRSISSQAVDAIVAAKEQMPCGFPSLGIPPLAPFKTEHQEININNQDLTAFGEANNVVVYGLNDFDIKKFKVNIITSRINFEFHWNKIFATADYEVFSEFGNKGLRRAGLAKIALKDIMVRGAIKYNFRLIGKKLSLKEAKIYVTLGEVQSEIEGLSKINIINKKLNRMVEKWIMLAINDNTDKIANMADSMIVPFVNKMLSDKNLSELLGGGGNGKPSEKVPCVPPEDAADYMKYFM